MRGGTAYLCALHSLRPGEGVAIRMLDAVADAARAAGAKKLAEEWFGFVQKAAAEAYNATNTSLNDMVSTVTENGNSLNSVSTSLSTTLKALRGDAAARHCEGNRRQTTQKVLAQFHGFPPLRSVFGGPLQSPGAVRRFRPIFGYAVRPGLLTGQDG